MKLIAYDLGVGIEMEMVPAPASYEWMRKTHHKFALRCLPMLMASQHGWLLLNPAQFYAQWNGGMLQTDTAITYHENQFVPPVISHFGHGILTWRIPYLFRTPKGVNLLVRGPANFYKDGVSPLEGLVETDTTVASFTMNWTFTRPGNPVTFLQGEPICMILPVRRVTLESVEPVIQPVPPGVRARHRAWAESRQTFLEKLPAEEEPKWQKDYMIGAQQSKLVLKPFKREDHNA